MIGKEIDDTIVNYIQNKYTRNALPTILKITSTFIKKKCYA